MRIAKIYEINLQERPLPDDAEVEHTVGERVIALLESQLRSRDKLQTERMQRFLRLANELGDNDEEKDLLAMLLDDFYQANFHPSFSILRDEPVRPRQNPKNSGASGPSKWSRRSSRKPNSR